MKIVLNHVQDMENVLKENVFVTLDGLETIVEIRYVLQTAQGMVNAIMEYVNVQRDIKARYARNMMYTKLI